MNVHEIITIDKNILGGQPVFKGTRVPVESLFDHLEAGVPLEEFLEDFPTVDLIFNSENIFDFYSSQYMRFEIRKHWNKLKKISQLSDNVYSMHITLELK